MTAPQRADARRNYARILTVAEEEVAVHGAGASLEQIARVAGVGSATVRRHFPTRRALLDAVAKERIEVLCARAEVLAGEAESSRAALLDWLGEVIASSARSRGLAAALAYEGAPPDDLYENSDSCATALETAGTPLLRRAIEDGAVAGDVTFADLVTLLVGIVLATEQHADPAREADRLFRLTVAGLSPS
ncbi:TetR/AcrR family transcriptional regulator [Solirubrobacter phytolaccae]|uniref:TetR/AcrR family transcriptional regulator n=1 Tax=Solirubrobacter phytolaccae TaxID=1404360 RepID=A0A9X3SA15_9ACTN|nr:TetR/AcrR family transcriptional regulator [Solirubrobacter phytolaccae]MDA0179825.1 TetR/AcrR family transcriptional regulator [Solirubrobacter phytolaccae]